MRVFVWLDGDPNGCGGSVVSRDGHLPVLDLNLGSGNDGGGARQVGFGLAPYDAFLLARDLHHRAAGSGAYGRNISEPDAQKVADAVAVGGLRTAVGCILSKRIGWLMACALGSDF